LDVIGIDNLHSVEHSAAVEANCQRAVIAVRERGQFMVTIR
jgi:hypothetical protein